MTDALIDAAVRNGGFAVLALVFGYLGFRGAQMWVGDVKAAAERERQQVEAGAEREAALTQKVLELVAQVTTALADLSGKIGTSTAEVAGLRAAIHGIRDLMTGFEARLYELEKEKRVTSGRQGKE